MLRKPAHQHGPHVQLAPDRLRVCLFSFVTQDRTKRDNFLEIGQLRKAVDDAVAETVGEIFRVWIVVDVDEWEDGNRVDHFATGSEATPRGKIEVTDSNDRNRECRGCDKKATLVSFDFTDQIFSAGSHMRPCSSLLHRNRLGCNNL